MGSHCSVSVLVGNTEDLSGEVGLLFTVCFACLFLVPDTMDL